MIKLYAKDFIRDNQVYISIKKFTQDELFAYFVDEQEKYTKYNFEYLNNIEEQSNKKKVVKLIYDIFKTSKDEFLIDYIVYLMSQNYQSHRYILGVDGIIEAVQPNKAFWTKDNDFHHLALSGNIFIADFWKDMDIYKRIVAKIEESGIKLYSVNPDLIFTIVADMCFVVKSKKMLMLDFEDLSTTIQMIIDVEKFF